MSTEPEFFMPPIKRHMYMTRQGPIWSGYFKATFFGPVVKPWGWYRASHLVRNNKEAKAAFQEWVADTRKFIHERQTAGDRGSS